MRSVWSHPSSVTGPGIIPLFWQRSWASEKFDAYRAGKWGRQDSNSVWVSSVAQSCPTLCDPMDRSTPDLSVHHQLPEFTQTHVHWVCMLLLLLSRFNRVRLCATPQTAAHRTPPSLGVSRQEHWSGFSSVQLLSRVQLFATPWIAARQASLFITKSRSILKLMPIKSVMPSSHLLLCHPLLLLPPIPPSIRVFSNESTLCMRWPKYWSFSFSISPSNEHPELISLRMDWFDLLGVG